MQDSIRRRKRMQNSNKIGEETKGQREIQFPVGRIKPVEPKH